MAGIAFPALVVLIGVGTIVRATTFPGGAGFYPILLGVLLVVLGVAETVRASVARTAPAAVEPAAEADGAEPTQLVPMTVMLDDESDVGEPAPLRESLVLCGLVIVTVGLIYVVGYIPGAALGGILMLRFSFGATIRFSILTSIALAITTGAIFIALGMQMPGPPLPGLTFLE